MSLVEKPRDPQKEYAELLALERELLVNKFEVEAVRMREKLDPPRREVDPEEVISGSSRIEFNGYKVLLNAYADISGLPDDSKKITSTQKQLEQLSRVNNNIINRNSESDYDFINGFLCQLALAQNEGLIVLLTFLYPKLAVDSVDSGIEISARQIRVGINPKLLQEYRSNSLYANALQGSLQ